MKRVFRLFYIVLAAILVIFLVVVIAVGLFANSALKVAVEAEGTKALKSVSAKLIFPFWAVHLTLKIS